VAARGTVPLRAAAVDGEHLLYPEGGTAVGHRLHGVGEGEGERAQAPEVGVVVGEHRRVRHRHHLPCPRIGAHRRAERRSASSRRCRGSTPTTTPVWSARTTTGLVRPAWAAAATPAGPVCWVTTLVGGSTVATALSGVSARAAGGTWASTAGSTSPQTRPASSVRTTRRPAAASAATGAPAGSATAGSARSRRSIPAALRRARAILTACPADVHRYPASSATHSTVNSEGRVPCTNGRASPPTATSTATTRPPQPATASPVSRSP